MLPPLPSDYEVWHFNGGVAAARRDVAAAVRESLANATLYAWAAAQPVRDVFQGRGETYGVVLGGLRAVVRHARRGGLFAPLLRDRYWGRPRYAREIQVSRDMQTDGVATPDVLAGICYQHDTSWHRADVATARVDGTDLASLFFGDKPPIGAPRAAIWQAVGELIGRLYRAGFVHHDLQLRNVLVEAPGGPALKAWLIDVDTVQRMSGPAARSTNLRRFYRSWDKWNQQQGPKLTRSDRESFSEGFARATR